MSFFFNEETTGRYVSGRLEEEENLGSSMDGFVYVNEWLLPLVLVGKLVGFVEKETLRGLKIDLKTLILMYFILFFG